MLNSVDGTEAMRRDAQEVWEAMSGTETSDEKMGEVIKYFIRGREQQEPEDESHEYHGGEKPGRGSESPRRGNCEVENQLKGTTTEEAEPEPEGPEYFDMSFGSEQNYEAMDQPSWLTVFFTRQSCWEECLTIQETAAVAAVCRECSAVAGDILGTEKGGRRIIEEEQREQADVQERADWEARRQDREETMINLGFPPERARVLSGMEVWWEDIMIDNEQDPDDLGRIRYDNELRGLASPARLRR